MPDIEERLANIELLERCKNLGGSVRDGICVLGEKVEEKAKKVKKKPQDNTGSIIAVIVIVGALILLLNPSILSGQTPTAGAQCLPLVQKQVPVMGGGINFLNILTLFQSQTGTTCDWDYIGLAILLILVIVGINVFTKDSVGAMNISRLLLPVVVGILVFGLLGGLGWIALIVGIIAMVFLYISGPKLMTSMALGGI